MTPKSKQSQVQTQKLSPRQIIQANIIQLNSTLLEQRIIKELEENPTLEIMDESAESDDNMLDNDDSDEQETDFDWDELDSDSDRFEFPQGVSQDSPDSIISNQASPKTLSDKIKEQLQDINISDNEMIIAYEIIGNLDDDGYFKIEPILIADRLGKEESEVLSVLKMIQALEPPGIASRNLRECLLAQIDEDTETTAYRIIDECFDEFISKKYEKICDKVSCDNEELLLAEECIKRKNPKPGDGLLLGEHEVIVPDIIMIKREEKWIIQLNDGSIYDLKVNEKYLKMLDDKKLEKKTRKFIKEKTESANWFIEAIRQRKETIINVMNCILSRQIDVLENESFDLKPMILKDIAEDLDIDISTVSRATKGKYVQFPWGVYELKDFFSESIPMEGGGEVSNTIVKNRIKEIIDTEDKANPLNDQSITNILIGEGYIIARRTVSKYRDMLQIPKSKLRRELK